MTNVSANNQYSVLLTAPHVNGANGSNGQAGYWHATVMGFPDIAEKAASREQVLQQIQNRLSEIMRYSEIVSLNLPVATAPPTVTTDEDRLRALGWDDHGLFKDYPEAMKLFDEIEEERNRNLC